MKKMITAFLLLTIIIISGCYIIYNNKTLMLKKQVGANIECQFGNMKITAEEFKTYLENTKNIENKDLYIFKGEFIKDRNLYQLYTLDGSGTYECYVNIIKNIDLCIENNNTDKIKTDIISELDKIISFNIELKKQASLQGDYYINWYNDYNNGKLRK